MKNYKEVIPNILTGSRIVFTPIIIILGFLGKYHLVVILAIICALTDLFDGKLARKWNAISTKGAKLDAVADKVFCIGLILCLVHKIKLLFIPLVLEILISGSNLFYYYTRTHKSNTLMVGKIKTTTLFLAIITSLLLQFYDKIDFLSKGFIYATINLQILCLLFYYNYYQDFEIEKVFNPKHSKKKMYDQDLEKTKKIDNLSSLITK